MIDWILAHGGVVIGLAAFVGGLLVSRFARWKTTRFEPIPAPSDPETAKRLAENLRPALIREAERSHERAQRELNDAQQAAEKAAREREEIRDATDDEILKRSETFADRKRSERKRRGFSLLVVGLVLLTNPCRALGDEDIAVAERNGAPGYWVSEWLWRETLADAENLLACQVAARQAQNAAMDARSSVEAYRTVIAAGDAELVERERQLAAAIAERDTAIAERDSWTRSRWLIGTAFMTGALVTAFGAYFIAVDR